MLSRLATLGRQLPALLRSSSSSLVVAQLVFIVFSYGVVVSFARIFGPGSFGEYGTAVSVVAWLELILSSSFHHSTVTCVARNDARKARRGIALQLVVSSLVAAGLWLFAPSAASLLRSEALVSFLRLGSLDIVPFVVFRASSAVLIGKQRFKDQANLVMAYAAAKGISMIGLAFAFADIEMGLVGMACASLLAALLGGRLVLHGGGNPRLQAGQLLPRNPMGGSGSEGVAIAASTLMAAAIALLLNVDLWVIQRVLRDPDFTGQVTVMLNFTRAFFTIIAALFMKLYVEIQEAASFAPLLGRGKGRNTTMLIAALAGSYTLAVVILIGPVVTILFGPDYSVAAQLSVKYLPIHAVFTLAVLLLQGLYYLGETRAAAGQLVAIGVGYALGSLTLASRWGFTGIMINLIAFTVLALILTFLSVQRHHEANH